jgi:hypothetical protein
MPACDLDRSVAFCFYNKLEKPNTLVSVFSGEVQSSHKEANCPSLSALPNKKIDSQLLQRLYEQCDGWIQRMHEKLAEEQGILN